MFLPSLLSSSILFLIFFTFSFQSSNTPVNHRTIHIIPHSHNDPGWKHTYEQYSKRTHAIIEQVYDQVLSQNEALNHEANDALKRGISKSENEYFRRYEAKRRQFLWNDIAFLDNLPRSIDFGKFDVLDGCFVQWDEALVPVWMQLNVARLGHEMLKGKAMEYQRKHPQNGNSHFSLVEPKIGWHVDAFGMSRVTPYVYLGMGFNSIILNRFHSRLRSEMRSEKKMQFNWNGLYVHVLYNHYNSPREFDFDFMPHIGNGNPEHKEKLVNILLEKAKEFETGYLPHGHIAFIWGDDMRFNFNPAKHFESMDTVIDNINEREDELGFRVRYSNVTFFLDEVKRVSEEKNLDVWKKTDDGDFFPYLDSYPFDYWTGYYSLRPDVKAFTARMEHMLRTTELLLAFRGMGSVQQGGTSGEYTSTEEMHLKTAQRKVALLEHHDGITGTHTNSVNEGYLDDVHEAETLLEGLMNSALHTLLGLDTDKSLRFVSSVSHRFRNTEEEIKHFRQSVIKTDSSLILFNPLSWIRKETIYFLSDNEHVGLRNEDGKVVPVQIVPLLHNNGQVAAGLYRIFFSVEISGLGVRRLLVVKDDSGSHIVASTCTAGNGISIGGSAQQSLHFDQITGQLVAYQNNHITHNLISDALRYISINKVVLGTGPYIFRVNWGIWMLVGCGIGYFGSLVLTSLLYVSEYVLCRVIFQGVHPFHSLSSYVGKHWRVWSCWLIAVAVTLGAGLVHFIYRSASDRIHEYILRDVYSFGIPVSLVIGFVVSACGGLRSWLTFFVFFLISYFSVYMAHPWINARSYFDNGTFNREHIHSNAVHQCFEGPLMSEKVQYLPVSNNKNSFLLLQYRLYSTQQDRIELQIASYAEHNTDMVVRIGHRSNFHSLRDSFFTDSNQLGSVKRHWKYIDVLQGNFYPVVSKMALEDEKSGRISSLVTSHAFGATSYAGKTFEVMVNRLAGQDDQRGLENPPVDQYNDDLKLWWNLNDSSVHPLESTWEMRQPLVMFEMNDKGSPEVGEYKRRNILPKKEILLEKLAETNSHLMTLQPIGMELPRLSESHTYPQFMLRIQNFGSVFYTEQQLESLLAHCCQVENVKETTFTHINVENYDPNLSKEIQTFVFSVRVRL